MSRILWAALISLAAASTLTAADGDPKMSIVITSSAFAADQPIPQKYTGDGQDVSPPLAWSNVPAGTRELALVCDDPDAPTPEPWVHWVIYKLPADASGLPEHVPPRARPATPRGALQGRNSWTTGSTIGYRGPAPPPGKVHHYRFHVYALDAPLPLDPELDKKRLLAAMQGHILGEGVLTGTYRR
jgi:Raf kinase inhibitor-like YbhB/YbcL family protein